jgi:fatty-acyl-CoA synthase
VWGEIVTAVVTMAQGKSVTAAELTGHVKERLASYKAPRQIAFVDLVPRGPNGKPDYPAARAIAAAARLDAAAGAAGRTGAGPA